MTAGSPWLFAVAFAASLVGGMLGMAGGIFVVPILVMFGGVELHVAIGASLVSVIGCSCGSAAAFLRAGLTNLRLAVVLESATALGALVGVVLAGVIPARALFGLFTAIMLLSAQQMLSRRKAPAVVAAGAEAERDPVNGLRLDASYPEAGRMIGYRVLRVPLGWALMFCAGMISALLGIGSGVLKIPAMDSVLRLPLKVSSATSSLMIGVTAAASAGAYFARGQIEPRIAGPVALGSIIGAAVGARLLLIVSASWVRLMFVVVLVALAIQMGLAAFGIQLVGAA